MCFVWSFLNKYMVKQFDLKKPELWYLVEVSLIAIVVILIISNLDLKPWWLTPLAGLILLCVAFILGYKIFSRRNITQKDVVKTQFNYFSFSLIAVLLTITIILLVLWIY